MPMPAKKSFLHAHPHSSRWINRTAHALRKLMPMVDGELAKADEIEATNALNLHLVKTQQLGNLEIGGAEKHGGVLYQEPLHAVFVVTDFVDDAGLWKLLA